MMRKTRRIAFTLVELLVVIAIISVLAAMLMPALETAIESARQIACGNNQKQTAMMLDLYANDYEDWYPRATGNSYNPLPTCSGLMHYGNPWSFTLVVGGYFDYSGDINKSYEEASTLLHNSGLLNCPSIPPIPLGSSYGYTLHQWTAGTYGMRSNAGDLEGIHSDFSGLDGLPARIHVTKVFSTTSPKFYDQLPNNQLLREPQTGPSKYPVGADSTSTHPGSYLWNNMAPQYVESCRLIARDLTNSTCGTVYRVHNDRANVWFLDEHVECLDYPGMSELIVTGRDCDGNIWADDVFDNSWPRNY